MRLSSRITAGALAAMLALPLSGCFGIGGNSVNDLADAASDIANDAASIAQDLQDVEWSKLSRAVVLDAATGTVVDEVTDQPTIEAAFEPFSQVNGLALEPEEPQEYRIEVWQPKTATLGQSPADVDEVQVLEVTTYQGSDVVTLTVTPIGLSMSLAAESGAADGLRALAQRG